MDFLKEAEEIAEKVISIRRHLHQYPEVSGQEFKTAEYIMKCLDELGIGYEPNIGKPYPGVVGIIKGKYPGKTIALRADMDALRQNELRECGYKSMNEGAHHGCGHDVHMAIQLGAAILLQRHREELHGNVKLIFQPCEEAQGGAVPMIRDGCLEEPQVDEIFGLHVDSSIPTGTVLLSYGETFASSDRLRIKIRGKSSHGAYPHEGIDAIMVASHVIVALQSLISRMKDALSPAVLSFGIMQGGTAPNVVCEEVEIRGILRTLDENTREDINEKIEKVIEGITISFGAHYEFIRERSHASLVNHVSSVDYQKEIASKIFGANNVMFLEKPRLIVEDFSYYLQKTKGSFWLLGTGNEKKNTCYPLHSTYFDVDEEAIRFGVAMQTSLVYDRLERRE